MIGLLLLVSTAFAQSGSFYQDSEGRVMYNSGYVCDDGITEDEADMICRNMGYSNGAEDYETSATIVSYSNTYTMDDLNCPSSTSSLSQCTWTTVENCSDNEALKVCCDGQITTWDCDGAGKVSAGGVIFGLLCCCCCYCVIPGVIIFMCIRGTQQNTANRYNANTANTNTAYSQPPATQMAPAPVYNQQPTGQQPYVATQQQPTYASPPQANNYAGPPQAYNPNPAPASTYAAPPSYNQPPAATNAPPAYGAPPPSY